MSAAARALLAETRPKVRRELLGWAIYEYGIALLDALQAQADTGHQDAADLLGEARDLLGRWLRGRRLTDRPDEHARRARALNDLEGRVNDEDAARMEALAILALPADHPERDEQKASRLLGTFLEERLAAADLGGYLTGLRDVLDHDLVDPERRDDLIAVGQGLLAQAPVAEAWEFRLRVIREYVERAIDARDAGDKQAQRQYAARAHQGLDAAVQVGEGVFTPAIQAALTALVADAAGEAGDAADEYERASEVLAETMVGRTVAVRTAVTYARAGRYDKVFDLVEPHLHELRSRYLRAVDPKDVQEAAIEYSTALDALVDAHIMEGRFGRAAELADTTKSLRLRFRVDLRLGKSGPRLFALERRLHALQRQRAWHQARTDDAAAVAGWVSLRADVERLYAQARAEIEPRFADQVSLAHLAAVLEADEAALLLSTTDTGTLAVVVTTGAGDQPAASVHVKDLTPLAWLQLLGSSDQPGWLDLSSTPWLVPPEQRTALLAALLASVEERLGKRLAAVLAPLGLRRLVVVPHLLLHLLPFDAFPSLRTLTLTTVSSAAALVATRQRLSPPPTRAVVVADPSEDLPLAAAEAKAVSQYLHRMGWSVDTCARRSATLRGVRTAARSAGMLHFAGHGRSDVLDADRSALFLHRGSLRGDPFPAWIRKAGRWRRVDEARVAEVPGVGRLTERQLPGDVVEWLLERPRGAALWKRLGPEPRAPAALWTAADILIEDVLQDCRLAVLVACESGGVGVGPIIDEYTGLPAALQLAGVDTVVATRWRVSDRLAALWVDLFYEELTADSGNVAPADAVHRAADRLRTMTPTQAAAHATALAAQVDDPRASFRLEAWASRLEHAKGPPFAEPWHWGAFYTTGGNRMRLRGGVG